MKCILKPIKLCSQVKSGQLIHGMENNSLLL
jgi:hypothetical protein